MIARVAPETVAWPLGRSRHLRGVDLWLPFDWTVGVIGPPGSGKTLGVLAQAALAAPGALVQTATKADDVLLTLTQRSAGGRPVAVCDPAGMLTGLPALVWDPLRGCADSTVATRRARSFAAGTVHGAASASGDPTGARREADRAANVLQGYLHAAALTGATLDQVMAWVADPIGDRTAETILRDHPNAERHWAGLVRSSLRDGPETAETVQRAMGLFLHRDVVRRCLASYRQRGTDIDDIIRRGGTIYLLGNDESFAPLLTAITDDVLDTAERMAADSPYRRLAPPVLAVLDDVQSTAPLPTLARRLAGAPGMGVCIAWAARSRGELITCYGEDAARAIIGRTGALVQLGDTGEKGVVRLERGEAAVTTGGGPAIVARLRRVGAPVLAAMEQARGRVADYRAGRAVPGDPSPA